MQRRNVFVDLDVDAPSHGLPEVLLSHLRTFLVGFQLDFGALDVVADGDGRPFIVDVNPTPYWGDRTQQDEPNGDSYGGILDHLRSGLISSAS